MVSTTDWAHRCAALERELAEAKAEVERLRADQSGDIQRAEPAGTEYIRRQKAIEAARAEGRVEGRKERNAEVAGLVSAAKIARAEGRLAGLEEAAKECERIWLEERDSIKQNSKSHGCVASAAAIRVLGEE